MTTLVALRADLAAFLKVWLTDAAGTALNVYPGPSVNVVAPCGVIQPRPDDDYLTGISNGAEEVRLQLLLLAENNGDPIDALDTLDTMLDRVRAALQWESSPLGLKYSYGPASTWGRWTVGGQELPGVTVDVTVRRTIDRLPAPEEP
jgi:hypothetical protein